MSETDLQIFTNILSLFERAVTLFSCELEEPSWSGDEDDGYQPRFANPTSGHFQLLMAVKIVSALNAAITLLKDRYVQEVGILLRVIDEYSAKILCIEEAHVKRTLTAEQKKIIDEYFQFDIRRVEDISKKNKWWVNMNGVFASQARFLSEGTPNKDTHSISKKCKIIHDVYTGYVHGFYPQVMELYDMDKKSFQMKGLLNVRQYQGMLMAFSSSIIRSFNVFAQMATRLNLSELREKLMNERNIFITYMENE